jgi:hypothetical protein
MKDLQGTVTLSATDLANHLSCRHLTTVELRLAKGEIAEPTWENPHLRVLQQRGLEHEKAYVEWLRAQGLSIVDLSNDPEATASAATWEAIKSGVQVIVQASLNLNRFNVATSRARCACIVIGSPRLFSPECRTARQMELANVLCRYAEMSDSVSSLV